MAFASVRCITFLMPERAIEGSSNPRHSLSDRLASAVDHEMNYVELDDTLTRFSKLNARHARAVELRVFGGLTIPEIATVLDVSHTTIQTDWY